MNAKVEKLGLLVVPSGTRVEVTTRTTKYVVTTKPEGRAFLMTNSPRKYSGEVEEIGCMDPTTGEIAWGTLARGKYMVFRYDGDEGGAVKTSLVLAIEIIRP